jgi:hypothetical protein
MNKLNFFIILINIFVLNKLGAQDQKFEIFTGWNESFRILEYTSEKRPPLNQSDTDIQSLNFGLRYNFYHSKSYGFKFGLDLSSYGFMDQKISNVRWPSEITPEGYKFDPSLPHEFHNGRKFIYLESPIAGCLKKSFGKWTPIIQLELIPQFLIAYKSIRKTDLENNSDIQSPPSSIEKFNLAVGANIGTYYRILPKVSIFLNGFYRRQLFGIVDAPITAKLYGMGINVGIAFDISFKSIN